MAQSADLVVQLRELLVDRGEPSSEQSDVRSVWITDVRGVDDPSPTIDIDIAYEVLRSGTTDVWRVEDVRGFERATDSADVEELATMLRIQLEEDVSALPSRGDAEA